MAVYCSSPPHRVFPISPPLSPARRADTVRVSRNPSSPYTKKLLKLGYRKDCKYVGLENLHHIMEIRGFKGRTTYRPFAIVEDKVGNLVGIKISKRVPDEVYDVTSNDVVHNKHYEFVERFPEYFYCKFKNGVFRFYWK